jgi:hypothetical protein
MSRLGPDLGHLWTCQLVCGTWERQTCGSACPRPVADEEAAWGRSTERNAFESEHS